MDAIGAIVNAAFSVETFFDGTRTDHVRMAEAMKSGEFLVATDAADRVAGCVYVERRQTRGYFGMLAVDPASQGQGLGLMLVAAAEDWCRVRGLEGIDITVLDLRPELLSFYGKLGYRWTREEDFHPSQPLKPGVICRSIVLSKPI
jgi:GNAT superfamily N-acetyltransferase